MTLRFDAHGRPRGLDWTVCNDGNPRPEVWDPTYLTRMTGNRPKHPGTKNLGIGRGGNVWMGAELERQIIDVYTLTKYGPYEIANMFNFTQKTIYRVLKRCEIPLRPKQRVVA